MSRTAASAALAGGATLLIATLSLGGWAFRYPPILSLLPGAVQVKANTALCLGLCGAALWLLGVPAGSAQGRAARNLGLAFSATVLSLCFATLAEYAFGVSLGIDEFLVKDSADAYNLFRGRMSPLTAVALTGIAAALATQPHGRWERVGSWGAIVGALVGCIALLGYCWNAVELTTDAFLPPVAVSTAFCLVLLGGGCLLTRRPDARNAQPTNAVSALAGIELRIVAGFLVALGLLLAGGGYDYRSQVHFVRSAEWVAHTQEVRACVAALTRALAQADVALRDYLGTSDPDDRADYLSALAEVEHGLGVLRRLSADNPRQTLNLGALAPLVAVRLDNLRLALDADARFGTRAARAVLATDREARTAPAIQRITDRIEHEEQRLLAERERTWVGARQTALVSLIATLVVAGAIFVALLLGVHREILARREAERALCASELYSRSIVDGSPDCLCVLTLAGRLETMTPQGRRLMKIDDLDAIVGADWTVVWRAADPTAAAHAFAAARSGAHGRFLGYAATHEGAPKWWDVIVSPLRDADGRPARLLAAARDLSELKRVEHELRDANGFLDSLIENIPALIVVKDAASLRVRRVNRAFERLLGTPRERLVGKTSEELFPADAAAIVASDREALQRGELVDIPEKALHPTASTVHHFRTLKMPLFDAAGRANFLLTISVDIGAQKAAMQRIHDLNKALLDKADQLAATNQELESFSYSVSHDLRAPLRAIEGYAAMLEEDCTTQLDASGRRYLGVIRENTRRMGELIDDLLEFSRLGRLPMAECRIDVETLVRDVVAEAIEGQARPPCIEIGRLPPATGDPRLLRQVWANLISNAIKYSSKRPLPRIEVGGTEQPHASEYFVRDNGVGFNMEYAHKLFGVFQRLHRADEFRGTGVGLAIVQRVVARHGGTVSAHGAVDSGAEFSFRLPRGAAHA
jgi:PAS domain S-box-containing protein